MDMQFIDIKIMDLEQLIEDEVGENGQPLSDEELDSLYYELQKLQMKKHSTSILQNMEVEINNSTTFKIKK